MAKTLLAILLFTLTSLSAYGQDTVVLKGPELMVEPGEAIRLDVRIENFTDILAVSFPVTWNEEVLDYQGVGNFNSKLTNPQFNFVDSLNALLYFWFQLGTDKVTLDDDDTVISLFFDVIGSHGDTSSIRFEPTSAIRIEFVTTDDSNRAVVLPYITSDGLVTVFDPTSTTEVSAPDLTLYQNYPNPAVEGTTIPFELKATSSVSLRICDLSGREIFRQREFRPAGVHYFRISQDVFPAAGAYFYTLDVNGHSVTREMLIR